MPCGWADKEEEEVEEEDDEGRDFSFFRLSVVYAPLVRTPACSIPSHLHAYVYICVCVCVK